MMQISFITATPPSVNSGMLLCDATARSFVNLNAMNAVAAFYRVSDTRETLSTISRRTDNGITFRSLCDHAEIEGGAILFWGDFLHMHAYQAALAARFDGTADTHSRIRRLLLLEGAPVEMLRRSITFATSILFNRTADQFHPLYGPSMMRFFRNAHHVQMRDAVSAAAVSSLRDSDQNCFGIDSAQLLAIDRYRTDILGSYRPAGQSAVALVFFSRGKHEVPTLRTFIEEVCVSVGASPKWFQWGDRISFPFASELESEFEEVPPDNQDLQLSHLVRLLRTIGAAKLVITDTYHLSIASWALGVPAVMVPGDVHDSEVRTKLLNLFARHDKRRVLYAQDGLMDFLVEENALLDSADRASIVARLAEDVNTPKKISSLHRSIRHRAERAEQRLLEAISSLPGDGIQNETAFL